MSLSIIRDIALFIRQNMQFVSFGITAVTIMLIGPFINGTVKRICMSMHWLLRYVVYVLLCTAGYGFLAHFLYYGIKSWLSGLSGVLLITWTLAIYLVLAWFAKQQKAI